MEPRIPSLLIDPALLDKRVHDNRVSQIAPLAAASYRPLPVEPNYILRTTHIGANDGHGAQDLNEPSADHAHGTRRLDTLFLHPLRSKADFHKDQALSDKSTLPRTHGIARNQGKKGVTLREVLNEPDKLDRASRGRGNSLSDILTDAPRKRKRADQSESARQDYMPGDDSQESTMRTVKRNTLLPLPRPQPVKRKAARRLPPLIQGLHQPPPNAGLFPPIAEKEVGPQKAGVPSETALDNVRSQPLNQTNGQEAPQEAAFKGTTGESDTKKKKSTEHADVTPKAKAKRNKWTEEETADLLRGVAQFGIGRWKDILACKDYKFDGRTAVDLKDRFRTCRPSDYKTPKVDDNTTKDPSREVIEHTDRQSKENRNDDEPQSQPGRKTRAGTHRKGAAELARIGIEEPFVKSKRRERRAFTADEDEALLKGFVSHGSKWHLIRNDPSLSLSHRKPTDLRDRMRNKFPEKLKGSRSEAPTIQDGSKAASDACQTTGRPKQTTDDPHISDPLTLRGQQSDRPSDDANEYVRLVQKPHHAIDTAFTNSIFASSDFDLDSSEDHSPVTLDRAIFNWVDANKSMQNLSMSSTSAGSDAMQLPAISASNFSNGITLSMLMSSNDSDAEYSAPSLIAQRQNHNTYLPSFASVSRSALRGVREADQTLPSMADLLPQPDG